MRNLQENTTDTPRNVPMIFPYETDKPSIYNRSGTHVNSNWAAVFCSPCCCCFKCFVCATRNLYVLSYIRRLVHIHTQVSFRCNNLCWLALRCASMSACTYCTIYNSDFGRTESLTHSYTLPISSILALALSLSLSHTHMHTYTLRRSRSVSPKSLTGHTHQFEATARLEQQQTASAEKQSDGSGRKPTEVSNMFRYPMPTGDDETTCCTRCDWKRYDYELT